MTTTFSIEKLKVKNSLTAKEGGTGVTSYVSGDILYASSIDTLSKIPIGTSNKVLVSNGTSPQWSDVPTTSGTVTLSTTSPNIDPNLEYTFISTDQISNVDWRTRIGSYYATATSITTDSTGSYVVGNYNTNGVTIYNADDTTFGTLSLVGINSIFIVKYDTSGTAQWGTKIGGTGTNVINSVTTDSTSIYVTGSYTSTISIYNSDDTLFTTLSSGGSSDVFLIKYDTLGVGQWATRLSGTSSDQGNSVISDSTGVYITGSYNASSLTIYNSDATTYGVLTNSGSTDTFLVKYDSLGFAQWKTRIAGGSTDSGISLTSDSTGIYIGCISTSTSLSIYNSDNTVFSIVGITSPSQDSLIVKYNTSGYAQWFNQLKTSTTVVDLESITSDSTYLYSSGSYAGTLNIYNSDGSLYGTLSNSGNRDIYLIKYDNSGFVQWAARMGGTGNDIECSITVNDSGITLSGEYSTNLKIYNSDGTLFTTLPASPVVNTFIVKYNKLGDVIWVNRILSFLAMSNGSISSKGTGIYLCGDYGTTITLYNSDGTVYGTLPSIGITTSYIVKYNDSLQSTTLPNRSSVGETLISTSNIQSPIDITVSNFKYQGLNASNISMGLNGDSIKLGWNGTSWFLISNNGAIIS